MVSIEIPDLIVIIFVITLLIAGFVALIFCFTQSPLWFKLYIASNILLAIAVPLFKKLIE